MIIPQILEDTNGRYLVTLEADYEIDYDFYCAIIFFDIDTIVVADCVEIIPGFVHVCRDETIYKSAIRKGIVLGVIFNDKYTK